jgi:simple sugar transport system ATP-binding protein
MRGIRRAFPGVVALDGVDFTLRSGEVHALMGENGAGKSTLVKVLTGVHPRDAGEVRLNGSLIHPASPQDAQALGISTVYQEVNLIPGLSVAENIMLGRLPRRWGRIDWGAVNRRAEVAMGRLGLDLDVTQPVGSCSIAIQQMTAIARALDVQAKALILDEPTSSLDAQEAQNLFSVIRKLRDEVLGIVFITHFLGQVYDIADRITVLRNGKLVGEYETASLPRLELVARMMGRDPDEVAALESARPADAAKAEERKPFLSVRGLGRRGSIRPFDLDVAQGEVVGLAGLLGSGRTEAARLLFGADRAETGSVTAGGRSGAPGSCREAIAWGLGFCPEDRKAEGIVPNLSVRENIALALQARRGVLRRLSRKQQTEIADRYIRELNIVTPDAETPIRSLSGGNQQKALLARWLAADPRLLILDEPTRGIDVGAKFEVAKAIEELRAAGMAILFISSELEEVVRSCGRVAVLRDREKIGELAGPDVSAQGIMATIAGSQPKGSTEAEVRL